MKKNLSVRIVLIGTCVVLGGYSVATRAFCAEVTSRTSNLCSNNQAVCEQTAANINLLSNERLKFSSRCIEAVYQPEITFAAGCADYNFIVETTLNADLTEINKQNKVVTQSCDVEGDLRDGPLFEQACQGGTSPAAIAAKSCSVQKAVSDCRGRGFSKCSTTDASVSFQTYYFNVPHCVATAIISN